MKTTVLAHSRASIAKAMIKIPAAMTVGMPTVMTVGMPTVIYKLAKSFLLLPTKGCGRTVTIGCNPLDYKHGNAVKR